MATRVLFVSHGETNWSFKRRLEGVAPTDLNDHGKEQSKMLADHIEAAYDEIDRIVSSPLRRAKQTTAYIQSAVNSDCTVECDDRLKQVDWGRWQGLRQETVADRHENVSFTSVTECKSVRPPDGESIIAARDRVQSFLDDVFCNNSNNNCILIVTHSFIVDIVAAVLTDNPVEQYADRIEHSSVRIGDATVDQEGNVSEFTEPSPLWEGV